MMHPSKEMKETAVRAMELMVMRRDALRPKFLLGADIHTRDLRCPVTCASCCSIYEGSRDNCPICHDSTAIGPVTELSMMVAKLRKS